MENCLQCNTQQIYSARLSVMWQKTRIMNISPSRYRVRNCIYLDYVLCRLLDRSITTQTNGKDKFFFCGHLKCRTVVEKYSNVQNILDTLFIHSYLAFLQRGLIKNKCNFKISLRKDFSEFVWYSLRPLPFLLQVFLWVDSNIKMYKWVRTANRRDMLQKPI
jgi:hypothetical protein